MATIFETFSASGYFQEDNDLLMTIESGSHVSNIVDLIIEETMTC